ncbi:signal peptidase I [Paenibacillus sp. 598K]|uniref:signal peptidase I n=1 Tax=Paenibacillus sp. 598K TaxID=1117987 RepID=UPI000FFADE75|nr:signal peptidase I [Paenibacillus sp. 598K]GBF78444.1 signal peptidase I [Paenibacillus sp. 598K]
MKLITIGIAILLLVGCSSTPAEEDTKLSGDAAVEPVVLDKVPEGMATVAYELDNMGRDRTQYTFRQDGELVIDPSNEGKELARGDIIMFDAPPYEQELVPQQISRVVALSGEKVVLKEGHIWINGEKLQTFYAPATKSGLEREDYIAHMRKTDSAFQLEGYEGFDEAMEVMTVPDDHYFVIGDNRWRSIDSRHFGAIPSELVRGKVIGVTEQFSIDSSK